MNKETCMYCRYGHKHWATQYIPGYGEIDVGPGYYGCHFLPYWGRNVETIGSCPKLNEDGTEREWSLRNSCQVNNR